MLGPLRSRLARRGERAALVLVALAWAIVALAWLHDGGVKDAGSGSDTLALATFLVRVLSVHLGIAAVLVAGGLWLARCRVAAVAMLPLAALLAWPATFGAIPLGSDDADAGEGRETITVMSINLLDQSDAAAAAANAIAEADPDVLVLQELTPAWAADLSSELTGRFDEAVALPRADSYGIGLYTDLDVAEEELVELGGSAAPQVHAVLEAPDGARLEVWGLHLPMPLTRTSHAENARASYELAETVEDAEGAVIVTGDLNHTERTRQAAALRDAGLRSAWDETHAGVGATWRSGIRLVPGLRLDHVLHTGDLAAVDAWRGADTGSDHRPIVAELALSL